MNITQSLPSGSSQFCRDHRYMSRKVGRTLIDSIIECNRKLSDPPPIFNCFPGIMATEER